MIKTVHIQEYKGSLDEAIQIALTELKITRENLIDIKYSTRVMNVGYEKAPKTKHQTWFSSALIIYEDGVN